MSRIEFEATAQPPSRKRSRSLGRAAKALAGTLKSQKEAAAAEEEWVPDRNQSIQAALEANASMAKNGTVAWPDCSAWRPKSMFDLYYKLLHIVERHEWEDFAASLKKPLPVTFRFVLDSTSASFRAQGEAILTRWAAAKNGTLHTVVVPGTGTTTVLLDLKPDIRFEKEWGVGPRPRPRPSRTMTRARPCPR